WRQSSSRSSRPFSIWLRFRTSSASFPAKGRSKSWWNRESIGNRLQVLEGERDVADRIGRLILDIVLLHPHFRGGGEHRGHIDLAGAYDDLRLGRRATAEVPGGGSHRHILDVHQLPAVRIAP